MGRVADREVMGGVWMGDGESVWKGVVEEA